MKHINAGIYISRILIHFCIHILWKKNAQHTIYCRPTVLNPPKPCKADADVESTVWDFST